MSTTITSVYDEIKAALGEHADDAYIFNPTTQAVEANPNR